MFETMPYFMEKEEWYNYDSKTGKYTLTDKAPKKARKSYEEWINREPYDPLFYGLNDEQIMQAVKAERARLRREDTKHELDDL